jgi:hypothetical protein
MTNQLVNEAKQSINYAERLEKAVENVTPTEISKGMSLPPFSGYEFDVDYEEAAANGTVTDMNDFYKQVSDRTSPLYKSLMAKYDYKETSAGSGMYYTISPTGLRVIAGRNLVGGFDSRGDAWNSLAEKDKYYTDDNGNKKRYVLGNNGTAVDRLVDEINREASSDKEQLDKDLQNALDGRKTSTVAHSSQRWPGSDDKESKRHQELVTDRLIDAPIPDSFVIKKDGKYEDVTGGIAQLGLKDAKTVAVDWVPDPVSGDVMYAVTVEGKNADDITSSKVIYINADQVKYVNQKDTDFISRVQNNTAFKIEHRANKAQHSYGLGSTSINIQRVMDNQGTIGNFTYEYDFANNKMKVFALTQGGKWDLANTYEIGSSQYYQMVNDPNIRIAK